MDKYDIPDAKGKISEFMLAEYATLRELRVSLDSLGEGRINFFLATISGSIVGLALINQLSTYPEIIYFINGAIFIGLLLFGFITFARMVERSILITSYTRGMNRVRRYFVDMYPGAERYLWLHIYDDRPSFGYKIYNWKNRRLSVTGLAPMVAIINSILGTVGSVILVWFAFGTSIWWPLLAGILTFILFILFHYRYLTNRMKTINENTEVRFPSPQPTPISHGVGESKAGSATR